MKSIMKWSLFVVCFGLLPLWAEGRPVIGMVPLGPDQDAPVQVVGVGALPDSKGRLYFGDFDVLNESSQPVLTVQLGWVLRHCGSKREDGWSCIGKGKGRLMKGIGPRVPVLILQGGVKNFLARIVFWDKLTSKIEERGLSDDYFFVEFGIVHVRFADGTEWEYDLVNESDWKMKPKSKHVARTSEGRPASLHRVSLSGGKMRNICVGPCPNEGCGGIPPECGLIIPGKHCCENIIGACKTKSCSIQCSIPTGRNTPEPSETTSVASTSRCNPPKPPKASDKLGIK